MSTEEAKATAASASADAKEKALASRKEIQFVAAFEKAGSNGSGFAFNRGLLDGVTTFTATAHTIEGVPTGDNFVVVVTDPMGAESTTELTENDGVFNGSYPVLGPNGEYGIAISLKNAPYVGSVSSVVLVGPFGACCTAAGPGVEGGDFRKERTEFVITAKDSEGISETVGGADFDVKATGPNGEELECIIYDNGDGTYTCSYPVAGLGEHQVEVSLMGQAINGSVFTPTMLGANPGNCTAAGPGVDGGDSRPEKAEFVITAKDGDGNPADAGGDVFDVKVKGPEGEECEANVSDNGDGTYNVEYPLAAGPGEYTVAVSLTGEPIAGSVFTVHMEAGNAGNSYAEGEGLFKGKTGRPSPFIIFAVAADGERVANGGDPFKVDVNGPEGNLECVIKDNEDGTYQCTYISNQPGDVAIAVTLFGEPIKDSPFLASIKMAPDASKCYAEGPGLKKAFDNKPARFTVHARDAEGKPVAGDSCTATVVGKTEGLEDVPVEVVDNGDGTFSCVYEATIAGEYEIHVEMDTEAIKDTPVPIRVREGADAQRSGRCTFKATISARNKQGELKEEGGDDWSVVITSSKDEEEVPCTTKDHGNGQYSVTYKLDSPTAGADSDAGPTEYSISMKLNDSECAGSPFKQFM